MKIFIKKMLETEPQLSHWKFVLCELLFTIRENLQARNVKKLPEIKPTSIFLIREFRKMKLLTRFETRTFQRRIGTRSSHCYT